ncbi:hypothetical protein BD779DRAFT_1667113 [Infundibulicybe gibba]|nr:hypothetical protein BD779DRAFT_1667113 [Infundibulicybe gibba]
MPATTRCYQALPWMPKIECLVLSFSDIDKKIWKVIGGLPMLKTLKIHHVSFRGDIPVEMDHIAGLQVSSLIIEPQVFPFPQSLNVAVLSELSCDLDTLKKFLTRGPISALKTLSIDSRSVFSMQSLMQVLSQIPSIDNLTICSEPSVEGPKVVPRDFPALLPNLRSLACHHAFLALLAPGRPLVNLNVWGRDGPPLNLSAALGSRGSNTASLDITRLDIPLAVYLTVGHLPRLHKLTLGFSPAYTDLPGSPDPGTTTELMELIVDACDKWAVNSSVRRLCITAETSFDPMDLDLVMQHTMLFGSLLQKFPALRRFRLGYRVKWERFAVDEEWQVFVPIKYRAGIVEEFEAGGPGVVDYDGYLRRLSTSNLP